MMRFRPVYAVLLLLLALPRTASADQAFAARLAAHALGFVSPVLSLTKIVANLSGAGSPEPGNTLEYTLSVVNTGTVTATNIVLSDPIPANTTYVSGSLKVASGANAGGKTDAALDDQAEYILGTNTATIRLGTGATATVGGSLAASATTSVTFRVTVNAGVAASTTLMNNATLSFTPVGGIPTLTTNASASIVTAAYLLSGTVFEDVNYGGGAGRSLAASSGVARPAARVELYDAGGTLKSAMTTNASGQYSFTVAVSAAYTVRVVSGTVLSSRPGAVAALVPVPTWINGDANRVGGENPAKPDAGNGSTLLSLLNVGSTVAQAITSVTVTGANVSGIDFGFNFDTVVNTNDSGQGSLRQFILNANALGNTGLAQAGQTAGQEAAIFMITDGAAHAGLRAGLASQLSSYGAAVITPLVALSTLTDDNTTMDGATQTTNVGDTNSGLVGTGGTVGADALTLARFARPEIEIAGGNLVVLTATGSGAQIKNVALYQATAAVSGANDLVQDCLIGMRADGTGPAGTTLACGVQPGAASGITIRHNYLRVDNVGIECDVASPSLTVESNELDSPAVGFSSVVAGINFVGAVSQQRRARQPDPEYARSGRGIGLRRAAAKRALGKQLDPAQRLRGRHAVAGIDGRRRL